MIIVMTIIIITVIIIRTTKSHKDPRTDSTQGFRHPQSEDPRNSLEYLTCIEY